MTRSVARSLPLFLLLFLRLAAPAAADDLDDEPKPRLRTSDRATRALVERGLAQSPSLRQLVDQLERTDVVVYVQCGRLRAGIDGQLTFVSAAGGLRYVIVQIAWELPPPRRIATLGHELQHALEIAAHPAIVDQASLQQAYAAIGFERERFSHVAAYDTEAAVRTGQRVARELATSATHAY
jgi:hypothetical protein